MSNNYSAPNATLLETNESGGSLQAGIDGEYSVELADILSEAWQKTKGAKRYILGAGILMYVIVMVVVAILTTVVMVASGADPESGSGMGAAMLIQFIIQFGVMALMLPFTAGIFVMCLKQVQGQQPEFGDLFSCFNKTGKLILTMILMYIMLFIGYLLFVIPGIYLNFAYMLAIPLIVDRDMGPWEALETSRKAITKHWLSCFLFFIVLTIIMVVSMIPLGLGLIWTVPLMAIAMAVLYREVFGITRY